MGFIVNKEKDMKINYELDQDGCLDVELIENSVDKKKEKGGDNILLQYINGGESMRIIERFGENVDIAEVHHHGKSLMIKFADGNARGYYQDKMGNYKLLSEFNENKRDNNKIRQNDKSDEIKENKQEMPIVVAINRASSRTY